MLWIEEAWGHEDLPGPVVATVGNYDGVHIGQQAILALVVDRARASGLLAAVVTFDPHPLHILRPSACPPHLSTPDQKRRRLEEQGVDLVAVIPFDRQFAATSAATFAQEFLAGRLRAREVYVGSRFVFGRDREGDVDLLHQLGAAHGFLARGVGEVMLDGVPVSSTRIRQAVAAGDVVLARRLLGRPFDVLGTIVPGENRGAALGWPTINLETENELLPANGVYTTTVRFPQQARSRAGVTNVGLRPTFGGSRTRPLVETHILDFSGDVYGERVEVAFHDRLRAEETFSSPQALSRQIGRDVEQARRYFSD